jgi:quercetin dioxygenase-like cupin family protein
MVLYDGDMAHVLLMTAILLAAAAPPERARVAIAHQLPSMDGAHLEAKLVEVNYGPGESSTPHTHPCPVIGYVVEGAVRMHIAGSPEAIYKTGDTFYEAPNSQHLVSANASRTARARLLAYFVCDHEAPLSKEIHEGAH